MNGTFESRHLGPNEVEIKQMLDVIGADSIATLLSETIPTDIALNKGLNLPDGISEHEFLTELQLISQKNKLFDTYIGLGYHPTITPAVIQRNILENPGWYTAYTPYQAEIAQGRLEALFNFQTVVTDLTGMELANASLLDESTAAAEAMTLLFAARSRDQKKNNSCLFFVSEDVLPQTLALFKTRAEPIGIQLVVGNAATFDFNSDFFGAFFQYPGKHGAICNLPELVKKAQGFDIKTVVAADLLSLTLLEAPGNYGVDAVVGTTQRFGIPLGYGGPHAAYFATREAYKRNLPGRIIGQTRDLDGAPALRMALQTREQHIKRDKATSNICTAQVLLAVMAGMYAVYHGPKELKNIATKIHQQAVRFEAILEKFAIEQLNENYFDTLLIKADATRLTALAEAHEINLLAVDADRVAIAFNETVTEKSFAKLVGVFEEYTQQKENLNPTGLESKIPANQTRNSAFLTHPVFNSYHSETSLMRYIKRLERKDLALNHSMISLGSCTMKLNAASEMLPLSWAQWNGLHPFVPLDQAQGYQYILKELEEQLNEVTGFSGMDYILLYP